MKKIIILILLGLTLSSCSIFRPHKLDVEQGNIYTSDQINSLHKGMSEAEVRAVMGTPVFVNIFSTNRLDYVYTNQPAYKNIQEKRIVCIFDHGRLKEILR